MTDFGTARQRMVDGQIRPSDVTDLRIIDAMMSVPREAFVPADLRGLAYLDVDVEVSGGRGAKRFLIKPVIIAKMLQAAGIGPADRVLVVGCATGYSAALAASLAGQVIATEVDPNLADAAATTLKNLGFGNVTIVTAAPAAGAPANAPFDAIILDGATQIPLQQLYGQLAEGGRLVGVFATGLPPRAEIVTRSPGDYGTRPIFDAYAPVLPGLERPATFTF
ncbi:MAG: protein-L-isoaspartate O-methyltransferase [Xanthobacteraceae bacterium]|nr:protein-L-isoaspartate O-methyltransferase [Xanthobacteraceae bacterium]